MIATGEVKNPVTISEGDLKVLKQFIENQSVKDETTLAYELKRAKVVKDDKLPNDVIKLGSKVSVKELASGREMAFVIVMPAEADMKSQKISILTPMGTALIGIKKGSVVEWKMPAGVRKFEIKDVSHT